MLAWWSRELFRDAIPISGLRSVTSTEVVSYAAIRAAWLQLRMPYVPEASESVSVVPPSCLWRNSGRSARTGHTRWWDLPSYSPSLTPYWKRDSLHEGELALFPVDPEAPTGWGAGALGPCDRTTVIAQLFSRAGHAGDSWGSWCPLPVTRQGRPPWLSTSWTESEKGLIQDLQTQDWPKATVFLGYDEVGAVKPLPHLGWRDWLDCILCQEDSNFLAQDRCVSDCHRSLENAADLGRSPGKLNCIAKSNCVNDPARRAGQCKPRPQTWYKWHQGNNRHTRGGAAERSRAGWYRRHRVLTHPRRTP